MESSEKRSTLKGSSGAYSAAVRLAYSGRIHRSAPCWEPSFSRRKLPSPGGHVSPSPPSYAGCPVQTGARASMRSMGSTAESKVSGRSKTNGKLSIVIAASDQIDVATGWLVKPERRSGSCHSPCRTTATYYATTNPGWNATAADMDADGKLDIVGNNSRWL
jgi:hypothetical protein